MPNISATVHIGLSKTSTSLLAHLVFKVNEHLSKILDMKVASIGEFIWQILLEDVRTAHGGGDGRLPPFMQVYRQGFELSDHAKERIEGVCVDYFKTEHKRALVMQEGFSDLIVFGAKFTDDPNFRFIMSTLRKYVSINIVTFVRRQDEFLESFYMQSVREGATWTFAEYIDAFALDNLDWCRLFDDLVANPDIDSVSVLPYEKPLLNGGGYQSTADAFFKHLDPNLSINADTSNIIANPSLDPAHVEHALAANKSMSPEDAFEEYVRISQVYPKPPYSKFGLFSEQRRADLIEKFAPSNKTLFEKYMPGFAPDYYLDAKI